MKTLLLCLMLTVPALSQDGAGITPYRWSVAALVAAHSLDYHSTHLALQRPGIREANPWLARPDGGLHYRRAAVAKTAVTIGIVAAQRLMIRNKHERKWATVTNFAIAAGLTVIAARNYRIQPR
jgi:hypothetical protein